MSATNSTPTINLPLFIGTDKPAWLTDWNGSMNTIDGAIATLQTAESGTATALASLSQSVTALSGTVEQHTTAIQTVTTATATNTGSINTITSLIGNGEPTTEDKTIIGAINEIYAEIGGGTGVAADDVTYSNTSSGLTATDVQAAIDEVYAAIPSVTTPDAEDVSYDNQTSGLTASNVQAAIDEVNAKISSRTLKASSTSLTNGAAINDLLTAFNNLTLEEKLNSYVTAGDDIVMRCVNTASGMFGAPIISATEATEIVVSMSLSKHYIGSNDYSSSAAVAGYFKLYA